MNQRHTPIVMFSLLLLALWASLYHKPAPAPQRSSAMPPLVLHAVNDPATKTPWQPEKNRITLVNFFASWCAPCLAEHEELKALSRIKALDVVGIAWGAHCASHVPRA